MLNLAICWLTPFFSSMQVMVTGNVAELEPVPRAVIKALKVNDIIEVRHQVKHVPAHVEDEGERAGARHSEVDDRQNNEAVDHETDHHCEEVHAQLGELAAQVLCGEDLAGDEEADTNWCEVDDPGSYLNKEQIKKNYGDHSTTSQLTFIMTTARLLKNRSTGSPGLGPYSESL